MWVAVSSAIARRARYSDTPRDGETKRCPLLLWPFLRLVAPLAASVLRIDAPAALWTTAALELHRELGARTGFHGRPDSWSQL